MKKKGKDACDYCGRTFRKTTPYVKYTDGSCYHHSCLKKVGSREDLGQREKKKLSKKSKEYFLWLRDKMGVIPPKATYEEFLDSGWSN